ncbi:MAG: GNAT family protein [Candidatus Micrarchaeota archaeon]
MKQKYFLLKSKRVVLRHLKQIDRDSIAKNANDKDVSMWLGSISFPYKKSNAEKLIQRSYSRARYGRGYVFGIVPRPGKEAVGVISLFIESKKHKAGTIGYWIGAKYRNQGYMTECVELVLKFAFRKLRLHRIAADHFYGNIASQRVLEKSGFVYEGRSRQAYLKKRKWKDLVRYSILRQEFEKEKGKPEFHDLSESSSSMCNFI